MRMYTFVLFGVVLCVRDNQTDRDRQKDRQTDRDRESVCARERVHIEFNARIQI